MTEDDWKGEHFIRRHIDPQDRAAIGRSAVNSMIAVKRRRKGLAAPGAQKHQRLVRSNFGKQKYKISERLPDDEIEDIMRRREAALAKRKSETSGDST